MDAERVDRVRQRLIDVERHVEAPATTCTAIVLLDSQCCLRCRSSDLERIQFGQPCLFRSHGHGALLQTTLVFCNECGASRVVQVQEVKP